MAPLCTSSSSGVGGVPFPLKIYSLYKPDVNQMFESLPGILKRSLTLSILSFVSEPIPNEIRFIALQAPTSADRDRISTAAWDLQLVPLLLLYLHVPRLRTTGNFSEAVDNDPIVGDSHFAGASGTRFANSKREIYRPHTRELQIFCLRRVLVC